MTDELHDSHLQCGCRRHVDALTIAIACGRHDARQGPVDEFEDAARRTRRKCNLVAQGFASGKRQRFLESRQGFRLAACGPHRSERNIRCGLGFSFTGTPRRAAYPHHQSHGQAGDDTVDDCSIQFALVSIQFGPCKSRHCHLSTPNVAGGEFSDEDYAQKCPSG